MLKPLFNKVAGLQLSFEYCKVFKNSLLHKTSSVAASEKFINLKKGLLKSALLDYGCIFVTHSSDMSADARKNDTIKAVRSKIKILKIHNPGFCMY